MLPDLVAKELQLRPRRWVYRLDDRGPFAYVQGRDLIRTTDHTVWAQLSDGALRSARSGRRIAYEVADVFYDAQTHAPVFYQSPELALPGAPFGKIRAVRTTRDARPQRTAKCRSRTKS
jgi:hypothetical protein